jgi:hypothetical protein
VKKTTSDVPMSLKKSPPETLIDQSITQNISLMLPNTNLSAMLVASSAKKADDIQPSSEEESEEQKILSKKPKTKTTLEALSAKIAFNFQSSSSSEESETESKLNAKYEAKMRALGHVLCNWQCYLSNCPAMRCQFKVRWSNFARKRCSILWSRTHEQNVTDIELIGCFC